MYMIIQDAKRVGEAHLLHNPLYVGYNHLGVQVHYKIMLGMLSISVSNLC